MAYVKHNFQPMDILHASEMNEIDDQVYLNSIQSYAKIVTQAEYDALSEAEKNSNVVYYVSDAPFDSPNVVTLTRAEYDALSEADKMDGRFYYVTDDTEVATSLVVQTNQNNPDTVPSSAVLYNALSKILLHKSGWNTSATLTYSGGNSGNCLAFLVFEEAIVSISFAGGTLRMKGIWRAADAPSETITESNKTATTLTLTWQTASQVLLIPVIGTWTLS